MTESAEATALEPFIGTFHKTGTTLVAKILKGLERDGVLNTWWMHDNPEAPEQWDIAFHYHSRFLWEPDLMSDDHDRRYVLLVRDPRDVIVSSVKYHLDATEEWLHKPNEEFGGQTYQQKLQSLSTDAERQVFEVERMGGRILGMMRAIRQEDPRIKVVHLERLMTDYDLSEFHSMFSFLGLLGDRIPAALKHAYDNSVFAKTFKGSAHIRSGKVRLWERQLTAEAVASIDEHYPGLVERLGYDA